MSTRTSVQLGKNSPFFNYLISQRPDHAEITIQFHTSFFTTRELPSTIAILETLLPRIFKHKCFNNYNRSFKKEAEQTELGHLFEHILLEFLCRYKFHEGDTNINLKGLTEWNWEQDPKGIFYISLNSKIEDSYLLTQAVNKTAQIMETIIMTNHPLPTTAQNYPQNHLES
jgi:hypothetical protein